MLNVDLAYDPPLSRRLRVAVMTSRRAPGIGELLRGDANRGRLYDLVCCIASHPDCSGLSDLDEHGVPIVVHDIHRFYSGRDAPIGDRDVREIYDRVTVSILAGYRPDLVVLWGYLYVITRPMLEAYPGHIVNIHHSDLTTLDGSGKPRYRGLRAVRDAVFAGEPETRSTVHIVTAEVDVGPLLVRSEPFPVHPFVHSARIWGAEDILKAYAYAHREWMMRACWGALVAATIELFALKRIRILDGRARVCGRPGPWDRNPTPLPKAQPAYWR